MLSSIVLLISPALYRKYPFYDNKKNKNSENKNCLLEVGAYSPVKNMLRLAG